MPATISRIKHSGAEGTGVDPLPQTVPGGHSRTLTLSRTGWSSPLNKFNNSGEGNKGRVRHGSTNTAFENGEASDEQ